MGEVAGRLQDWLGRAPDGPISLESGSARGVVKAFVDGWGPPRSTANACICPNGDGTAHLLSFDGARQLGEGLVIGLHSALLGP